MDNIDKTETVATIGAVAVVVGYIALRIKQERRFERNAKAAIHALQNVKGRLEVPKNSDI